MNNDKQIGEDDLVIVSEDGKSFYWVPKEVYTAKELPVELQATPRMLRDYGTSIASVSRGTTPGVGAACYLVNLASLKAPKKTESK